jgi:CHASE2 domain-containing sensor protein
VLLSLGLVLTFVALAYKDFKKVVTARAIGMICALSIAMFVVLYFMVPPLVPAGDHHSDGAREHAGEH